ncbi:Autophagy-related protein 28 [Cladobotryum mycophilum]|uniref:Autophagy-related protein 28 n=1 Tax=Cladobotryum mycophilum TaxID=491253 RepID=A0ABR0SMI6_9HYPO
MASPGFFDRITSPRMRSPILPIHHVPKRSPSEYQLEPLSPRPDDAASLDDDLPRAWVNEQDVLGTPRGSSPSSWRDKASSPGSPSKMKPRAMFAGPPPPITASMMLNKDKNKRSPGGSSGPSRNAPQSLVSGIGPVIGSVLFDQRQEMPAPKPDSRWRGLRRQENALEQEIQQLLDFQAAGLIAGSGGSNDPYGNDVDAYSDGSSTPTGTFYSTKSSKSRMTNSLYVPTRATPDGNVIPVRQPTKDRPLGLRATRAALQKTIMAMARVKQEEDMHLEAALAQRKDALAYLETLSARKVDIHTELNGLDEGGDEPLGKELRELGIKHDTLDKEIHRLEEKLMAMRNRRRWLKDKMEDIQNKRDAGLSGYRGALKQVDAEVTALMHKPPIQPLDPDILSQPGGVDGEPESPGGIEFLRLIPERRTLEMTKSWWENEVTALESRRARIDADRQALEEGGAVWELVMQLVTDFESSLRQIMKPPSLSSSAKGKEKLPSQEGMIQNQLPQMKNVVEELERHMVLAEEKHWNLLICAIGAELEAFKEAYSMLEGLVEVPENDSTNNGGGFSVETQSDDQHVQQGRAYVEESDNEVPSDLLGSHADDHHNEHDPLGNTGNGAPLQRYESGSENEVPSEFLAENASQ